MKKIITFVAAVSLLSLLITCNPGEELFDEIKVFDIDAIPYSGSEYVEIDFSLQNNTIYDIISMTIYFDVDFADINEQQVEELGTYFAQNDIIPSDKYTFSCSTFGQSWENLQGVVIDKILITPEDDVTETYTVKFSGENGTLYTK